MSQSSVRLRSLLILLLLVGIHGVIDVAGKGGDNDDEKSSSWRPLFLRRRHRARDPKEGAKVTRHRSVWNETASVFEETRQLMGQRVQKDFRQFGNDLSREVRTMQQEFKKGLKRDVFHQYVGWQRLRHSLRDHLGVALGFWVTFRGYVEPLLASRVHGGKGGAWTLHLAQVIWRILNTESPLPHFPWLNDLVSMTVAVVSWKYFLPRAHPLLSQGHVLFAITLLPLCSLVLEEWSLAPFPIVSTIVGLIFLALKAARIPIPMAASSLSGALLVFDSARAEIAGNWVQMMEVAFMLGRTALRLIRRLLFLVRRPVLHLWRQWLKGLVKKLLYPEATKNLIGQLVSLAQKMWRAITYPINNVKERVANITVIRELNQFSQRLRKAIRPVLVPFGIATWGVAVQIDYISGMGGAWKVLRISVDPVAFVKGRIKGLFSPESRVRKALTGIIRSLPRQLQSFLRSREKEKSVVAASQKRLAR